MSSDSRASAYGLRRPQRPLSLDHAVLDSLTAYIDSKQIALGSRLPSERELCEALGVGRSTVREALKRWEALGIVEMRKGSGAYLKVTVSPGLLFVPLVLSRPSKVKSLLHILEIRRGLEGEAAAVCAASASDEDIATIEACLLAMERKHAIGNASEEDWLFHQSIFAATGNPFFPQIIQSMRGLLHQLWENALALPNFAAASHPYHRTMYEAIARRDAGAARFEAWKLVDSVALEIKEAFPNDV